MQRLKDEVRDELLRAAEESFLENGIIGSTLRDIAKASGMSVGNIFHYYKGNADLFEAVLASEKNERTLAALRFVRTYESEGGPRRIFSELSSDAIAEIIEVLR